MAKQSNTKIANQPAIAKSKSQQSLTAVRPKTKQALLIDLLKRKNGATIDDAIKATGWHPVGVARDQRGSLQTGEHLDGVSCTTRLSATAKSVTATAWSNSGST